MKVSSKKDDKAGPDQTETYPNYFLNSNLIFEDNGASNEHQYGIGGHNNSGINGAGYVQSGEKSELIESHSEKAADSQSGQVFSFYRFLEKDLLNQPKQRKCSKRPKEDKPKRLNEIRHNIFGKRVVDCIDGIGSKNG